METETQRDDLVALGCDEPQGCLFAKPMSATAFGLWAMGNDGCDGYRKSPFTDTLPGGCVADWAAAPRVGAMPQERVGRCRSQVLHHVA